MIIVKKGDITKEECDAIVNPANSYGWMGGGVAGVIKKVGGKIIEDEAIAKAPVPVGTAIITTAGRLPCKYVIHAPTMQRPGERIGIENVRKAIVAALQCAISVGIKSIAIPGLGTGVGGVKSEDAAKIIVEEAKKYDLEIRLVDIDGKVVNAYRKYVDLLNQP